MGFSPAFWVAGLGMAVAAYILIGYPLLLAFNTGTRRPPVHKNLNFRSSVTIVVAVYNGAAFLRTKLESILELDYPRDLVQVLIVSDGSTDRTEEIVRQFASQGVELLVRPHAGKASALNAAFERAQGEIIFFTDVRQKLDPLALQHLVANFADPTVGAVTGEMRLLQGDSGEQKDMGLYWRYELWARSKQSEIDSLFNTTGCVYALRRIFATPLPPDTLSDDAVLPLRAFFAGMRVVYDPAAIAYDYPALAGTEFRRRWRNLAGLWQVHTRTPQLFLSANRMRPIPYIHPEAKLFSEQHPGFHFATRSVFTSTPGACDVLRTMNIFNRAYFSEQQLIEGGAAAFASLTPGGLWIVGRTLEQDFSNHVTFLRRGERGWEVLGRIGSGSEMEPVIL